MAKQINVDLRVNADVSQAKRAMQELQTSLTNLGKNSPSMFGSGFTKEIGEAQKDIALLKTQLQSAFNVDTGKLDFTRFNAELQKSGKSLSSYAATLTNLGPEGTQAFMQLANAVASSEIPVIRLNSKVKELGTALANTARWQLSSSILHGFMGAIQSAYGYAKSLNQSLNDIRIVTGQSADQMDKFAERANKAAQALSTTTTEYTKASLIFYQQGLSDDEVEARTNTTIKMAHAAGESASEVSSYMTAIWNNFAEGADNLEYYGDVITKLGAMTAASSAEIAGGLEKFAAVADTVGLSYEYAAAAVTTIVDKTRQSEDVVGTSLKTIFARLDSLKQGGTDEDGTDLTKYSKALAEIGVNVKDENSQLREMNDILDDLGPKWAALSKGQKVALAQTVGGMRQYSQFISLMDNYTSFKDNVDAALNSAGTLEKQQEIYAEGLKGALDRLEAAKEAIYNDLIDDDFLVNITDALTKILKMVDGLVDGMGGLKGVLGQIVPLMGSIFSKQIATSMVNSIESLKMLNPSYYKAQLQSRNDALAEAISTSQKMFQGNEVKQERYRSQLEITNALVLNGDKISEAEKAQIKFEQDLLDKAYEDLEAEKEKLKVLREQNAEKTKEFNKNVNDLQVSDDTKKEIKTIRTRYTKGNDLAAYGENIGGVISEKDKERANNDISAMGDFMRQNRGYLSANMTEGGLGQKNYEEILSKIDNFKGGTIDEYNKFIEELNKKIKESLEKRTGDKKVKELIDNDTKKQIAEKAQKVKDEYTQSVTGKDQYKDILENSELTDKQKKEQISARAANLKTEAKTNFNKQIEESIRAGTQQKIAEQTQQIDNEYQAKVEELSSKKAKELDKFIEDIEKEIVKKEKDAQEKTKNGEPTAKAKKAADDLIDLKANKDQKIQDKNSDLENKQEIALKKLEEERNRQTKAVQSEANAEEKAKIAVAKKVTTGDVLTSKENSYTEVIEAAKQANEKYNQEVMQITEDSETLKHAIEDRTQGEKDAQKSAENLTKSNNDLAGKVSGEVNNGPSTLPGEANADAQQGALKDKGSDLLRRAKTPSKNIDLTTKVEALTRATSATVALGNAANTTSQNLVDLTYALKNGDEEALSFGNIMSGITGSLTSLSMAIPQVMYALKALEEQGIISSAASAGPVVAIAFAVTMAVTTVYNAYKKGIQEIKDQADAFYNESKNAIALAKENKELLNVIDSCEKLRIEYEKGITTKDKYKEQILETAKALGIENAELLAQADAYTTLEEEIKKKKVTETNKYLDNSFNVTKDQLISLKSNAAAEWDNYGYSNTSYTKRIDVDKNQLKFTYGALNKIFEGNNALQVNKYGAGNSIDFVLDPSKIQSGAQLKEVYNDINEALKSDAVTDDIKNELKDLLGGQDIQDLLANAQEIANIETDAWTTRAFYNNEAAINNKMNSITNTKEFEDEAQEISKALAKAIYGDESLWTEFYNNVTTKMGEKNTELYSKYLQVKQYANQFGLDVSDMSEETIKALEGTIEAANTSFNSLSADNVVTQMRNLQNIYDSLSFGKELSINSKDVKESGIIDSDGNVIDKYKNDFVRTGENNISFIGDKEDFIQRYTEDVVNSYLNRFENKNFLDAQKTAMDQNKENIRAIDESYINEKNEVDLTKIFQDLNQMVIEGKQDSDEYKKLSGYANLYKTEQEDYQKYSSKNNANVSELFGEFSVEQLKDYSGYAKKASDYTDNLTTAVLRSADAYGIDKEAIADQAEYLKENNKYLKDNQQMSMLVAYANERAAESLSDLVNNIDDYTSALKHPENVNKYSKALKSLEKDLQGLFNTNNEVSEDFIKDNLDDIKKAAKNDEDAIIRLGNAYAQTVLQQKAASEQGGFLTTEQNNLFKLLEKFDSSKFEAGMSLDTTEYGKKLLQAIQSAKLTAEEAQTILNSIRFEGTVLQNADGTVSIINSAFKGDSQGTKKKKTKTSSSSKKKDAEKERYYTITKQISDQEKALDRLAKAKDRAYGNAHLEYIQLESEALGKEIDLQKQLIKEVESYYKKDQAKMNGYGAKYDENGVITNYDAIWNKAKKKGDTYFENFEKALKQYEETRQKWYDENDKLLEKQREQYDKDLEGTEYKIKITLELDNADLELLEYRLSRIQEQAFSTAQELANLTKQAAIYQDEINGYNNSINEILGRHNITDISQIAGLSDEQIKNLNFTDAEVSALREYNSGLLTTLKELDEIENSMVDGPLNVMQEWNEEMDKLEDKIEHSSKVIQSYRNITDLTKANTGLSSDFTLSLQATQYQTAIDSVSAATQEYEANKLLLEQAQMEYDKVKNDTSIDQATKDRLKSNVEEMEDIVNTSQDNMLSNLEDALKKAQELMTATVEAAKEDFNSLISATGSMDFDDTIFDHMEKMDNMFLDDYEKIYQFSKLSRDINKSISKESSADNLNRYKEVLEEIQALEESGEEITQYQVDALRKKYELAQAYANLQDSQNAKSTVRMSRDSEGNMSYIYSGNDNADALQAYEDKLYEYQKLNSDYVKEQEKNFRSLEKEASEAFAKIAGDLNLSDEQKAEQIQEMIDYYNQMGLAITNEIALSLGKNKELYDGYWLWYSEKYDYAISAEQDYQTVIQNTHVGKLDESITSAKDLYDKFIDAVGDKDKAESYIGKLTKAWQDYYDNQNDALKAAGTDMESYGAAAAGAVASVGAASKQAADQVKDATTKMSSDFNSVKNVLEKLKSIDFSGTRTQIQNLITQVNNLISAYARLSTAANNAKNITQTNSVTKATGGNDGGGGGILTDGDRFKALNSKEKVLAAINDYEGLVTVLNLNKKITGMKDTISTTYQGAVAEARQGIAKGRLSDMNWKNLRNYVATLIDNKKLNNSLLKWTAFDTGGYTGAWNTADGKLAVLHEKELVLNKDDTENMLKMIDIARQVINTNPLTNLLGTSSTNISNAIGGNITQNISINATFTDATTRDEITAAFENLINRTAQYAGQKKY